MCDPNVRCGSQRAVISPFRKMLADQPSVDQAKGKNGLKSDGSPELYEFFEAVTMLSFYRANPAFGEGDTLAVHFDQKNFGLTCASPQPQPPISCPLRSARCLTPALPAE